MPTPIFTPPTRPIFTPEAGSTSASAPVDHLANYEDDDPGRAGGEEATELPVDMVGVEEENREYAHQQSECDPPAQTTRHAPPNLEMNGTPGLVHSLADDCV